MYNEQAIPSEEMKNITDSLTSNGFDLIFDVLDIVHDTLKDDSKNPDKNLYFRKRTADEIFRSGIAYGCTDYALVTLALLRARGMNADYVEAFSKKWLTNGGDPIEGHVFAEVVIDGKTYIINPQANCILRKYRNFAVYKRGRDSWEIGIHNFEEMAATANEFRKQFLSV